MWGRCRAALGVAATLVLLAGCTDPTISTLTIYNQSPRPVKVDAVFIQNGNKQVESVTLVPKDSLNVTLLNDHPEAVEVSVNGRKIHTYKGAELPQPLQSEKKGGKDVNLFVLPSRLSFEGPTFQQTSARQNWPMILTPFCCGLPLVGWWIWYNRRRPRNPITEAFEP